MNLEEFRKRAHEAVDWVAAYYENLEKKPVKSQSKPNDIYNQIPDRAPKSPEPFDALMNDLNNIIMPGITHWQHPHFHAYFPANASFPSIIAEILTAGMGAQCMVWETSPAAAELEERMMEWLKNLMKLPTTWSGVIHDTASTATLTAILSAREQITQFAINNHGFEHQKLRVYCSTETHSSIEKGAKIAGIGKENVVKIPVDEQMAMNPKLLDLAIESDLKNGFIPCCVIAAIGTTSTVAIDPTDEIGLICQRHNVWLHVDAAYAGSAMILPEMDYLRKGLEYADSFVFNPHKWLFTNFDLSAYFVKDKNALIDTFEILPEYLKTKTRGLVNDYRDWGIQLGRRFRALKLWFVMRSFGVENMQKTLRNHIDWAKWFEKQIADHPDLEILVPRSLNVLVFRVDNHKSSQEELNQMNENLLQSINNTGKAFITHTKVNGKYGLRVVLGQTYLKERHVQELWDLLQNHVDIKN